MKRSALFGSVLLVVGIGMAPVGNTGELTARPEVLSYVEKGQAIPTNMLEELAKKEQNLEVQTDVLLNYLLSVPFEQRQYIFPALFDEPNLPRKIRTHPEIAIWEGKLPTDIKPEAREYAEKYLADLNPKFYIFLSPYTSSRKEDADLPRKTMEEMMLPMFKGEMKVVNPVKVYPELTEVIKQSESLQKNPDLATLTSEDIQKIDIGLKTLADFLNQNRQKNAAFKAKYDQLSTLYTDRYKEKVNPFQAKWERLKLMNEDKKLEENLKKAGWQSGEDFIRVADTITRAYRASWVPLQLSLQAWQYRAMTPTTDMERMVSSFSKMYESLPRDVQLVQENREQVRNAFIQAGFQSALDAETIDALRK